MSKKQNGIHTLVTTGLLGLSAHETKEFFPEFLQNQLDHIMNLYKNYNEKLPKELQKPERSLKYVNYFFASFLTDRNRRSNEIIQAKYKKAAVEKAKSIIPMPTFFVDCMDGRVKPVHTNGLSADTTGAIRTPGGLLNEFVREDGKLILKPDSIYAKRLLTARNTSKHSAQVFDSHLFCAARTKEEAATGNHPDDYGLRRDVIHKKEMFQATSQFLTANPQDDNEVIQIQTSFNPVTGYIYMGLETSFALKYSETKARQKALDAGTDPEAAVQYAEYTKDVLKELIIKKKILSTGALIKEKSIISAFQKNSFKIDRQKKYIKSAILFWDKMVVLQKILFPTLKRKIIEVYPNLVSSDQKSQKELQQRAFLLLSNAFNTYLTNSNHDELAYLNMDNHDYEKAGNYKYGAHSEAGVKVSEGGHPPYDITMLVVYSQDLENMPSWVELASSIVRNNRANARVDDPSGNYKIFKNKETQEIDTVEIAAFEKAPVGVVMQEIIRNVEDPEVPQEDWIIIPDLEWKRLETTDWSDLPKNWESMSHEEFESYLVKNKKITHALLIEGIERLRQKMARLYHPSQVTSSHLKDLYKAALPIICDQNRQTHSIIPFLKVGRKEKIHLSPLPKAS